MTPKATTKIKDSLKEEKRTIAEDGKHILQKNLKTLGAVMNQAQPR